MTGPGGFDAGFSRASDWVSRRRRAVFAFLALLAGLSLWRLPRIPLENNLEALLPAGPGVAENFRFLRQAGFSDRVALSLSLPQDAPDPARLAAAVDTLAAGLPGEWVTEAETGPPGGGADWAGMLRSVPQMAGPDRVDRWREELTPGEVSRRVGALARRLLAPGASAGPMLAADPLGIGAETLGELQGLSGAFGYRVRPLGRHLFSEDGRHALLLLRTPVPVPDAFGARALLDHLDRCLAGSPEGLRARIVAGHRHTVSNEDAIRGDLRRVGGVAALGFCLLVFGAFRDARAVLVFLAPLAGLLLAVAAASVVFSALSHFLLGMSVVLAGISLDYAIHVYAARRTLGPGGVAPVARPVIVGACTTSAVFVTFFLSSVPGYSQLALFSLLSLGLCLAASLFLLPLGLRTGPAAPPRPPPRAGPRIPPKGAAAAWLLALAVLGASAGRIRFERDIGQFDGSAEEVFRDEREFRRIWGGENPPAMLVAAAKDPETAWRAYETASERAAQRLGDERLVSMAPLWPSPGTRAERARHWGAFWSERGPAILGALAEAGARHGFTPGAFEPFAEWAAAGGAAGAEDGFPGFHGLMDRFRGSGPDGAWAAAYFEDTPENRRRLSDLEGPAGDAEIRVISRGALSHEISRAIARETRRLSLLAVGLILVPLFLLTRNLRRGLLALAPVATAGVAVLGALPAAGRPLTAASLVAGMIVLGLVIDYGVYIVFDEERGERSDPETARRFTAVTRRAIHLSAGTTLIGAGALLRARHPVMFDIGFTLVAGVGAGYLSAVWGLPALCRLTRRGGR